MGYGFGYGPLRTPAVLLLRPAVPSPFALPYLSAHQLDVALINIVTSGEGRLRHQAVVMGVAKNQYENRIIATPG